MAEVLQELGLIEGDSGRRLRLVAMQQEAWPDGGLVPLQDTRDDEALRLCFPAVSHYDLRLADLRV